MYENISYLIAYYKTNEVSALLPHENSSNIKEKVINFPTRCRNIDTKYHMIPHRDIRLKFKDRSLVMCLTYPTQYLVKF